MKKESYKTTDQLINEKRKFKTFNRLFNKERKL